MNETKTDHARDQAQAQLEGITNMVRRLEHARDCDGEPHGCDLPDDQIYAGLSLYHHEGDKATDKQKEEYHDQEAAEQRIHEDPLEVSVRHDWHTPGQAEDVATDYLILLCTGGPACRIIGTLGQYAEPDTARLEYQDWFTPWTDYPLDSTEEETVLTYAQQFYFGDG